MVSPRAILIMAGGRGTRLWPLSRRGRAKQFLALASDRPLLEDTYRRVAPLTPPSHIYVIAEEDMLLVARPILPEIPLANFIAEPYGRNTWPCCALGTAVAARRLGEDAVVLVIPADHAVADDAAFRAAAATALERAAAGAVVTFGIRPDRPETGYGYVKCGAEVAAGPPRVRAGHSFHEKPDEKQAAAYVASGDYLWNGGMFTWRADRFAALTAAVCDDARAVGRLRSSLAAGGNDDVPTLYRDLRATSVDYAFMEKLDAFEVVELDCGWDDIGSFEALARVLAPDDAGNVGRGDAHNLGGGGNVVVAAGRRPVVLLDAEDLVVIDAGDVVLIYPRGKGQEVRRAVAWAKENRPDLL